MFSKSAKTITRSRSAAFWLLALYLPAIFLFGGSSRDDVQSAAILQPLAVFLFALALIILNKKVASQNLALILSGALLVTTISIYLVPMPHTYWNGLASHRLIEEVDRLAKVGSVWRPLAINHIGGISTLFAVLIPLSVLLLSIQTKREERLDILMIAVCLGLLSALLGLFQAIGDPDGPLYFYRITNNGSAVGLFANRNHQATLIATLFPMIAIFASANNQIRLNRYRGIIAIAFATFLVPMILVTGSRAGLVLGALAIISALCLYWRSVRGSGSRTIKKSQKLLIASVSVVALLLGLVTILASRATALERLLQTGDGPEDRLRTWSYIMRMAWDYFPLGTGPNGFSSGYAALENTFLLDSTYLNKAHNDWIELFVTFGLPAVILMVIGFAAIARKLFEIRQQKYEKRDTQFILLGLVILMILSLSSFVDYAGRTPAIASVAMLALSWVFVANSNRSSKLDAETKNGGSSWPSPLAAAR